MVPGFTEELLKGVLQKESKQDVNYAKSLLKMASDSSTSKFNKKLFKTIHCKQICKLKATM